DLPVGYQYSNTQGLLARARQYFFLIRNDR
ncbi:MAG: hypothetical protein ACJA2O_004737, partial [Candidatus Azotimanducaceae bacterium]